MLGDPVGHVMAVLAAGFPDDVISADPAELATKGLGVGSVAVPRFVYVTDQGGRTVSPLYLDLASVTVVTYTRGDRDTAMTFARTIQSELWTAWYGQTVTEYGHIRRIATDVRPYIQNLSGLPANIKRTSATYSLGMRTTNE